MAHSDSASSSSRMPHPNASNPANPMFSPSSPIHPSSPNTQLTMQLLGSLMQGLDGGFSLPSSAVPVTPGAGNVDFSSFPMNSPPRTSPNAFLGSAGQPMPSSLLLEQQIKLQQLQQLHQLQNQIFQQQMALISSSSPAVSKSAVADHYQHQDDPGSSSYTGLPTPGPSTELRPQQQSMEFVSPMILNNYNIDAESSTNSNPHSHSHTPSPMITSTYREDVAFSQQLPPPMAPQASMDFVGPSSHHHHHAALHRGIASAPEHLAFDIRSGREFDLDVSPLTSPWLGPYGESVPAPSSSSSSSNRMRMAAHRQSAMGHIEEEGGDRMGPLPNGNKRTASPSTDDHSSRKKHSPAIGPTMSGVGMFGSRRQGGATSAAAASTSQIGSGGHRTSKSTSSTQPVRGARNRSKSGVAVGTSLPVVPQQQGSESGGSGSLHPQQHKAVAGIFGGVPEDSPSPVDLAAPPMGVHGDSDGGSGGGGADLFSSVGTSVNANPSTTRLTPVTPASIMNLGRLGMSTSNNVPSGDRSAPASAGGSNSSTTPTPTTAAPTVAGRGTRTRSGGGTKSLKAILPAGDPNPKPSGSSVDGFPPGQKKTSHKAAEQKRRDSLKTTFDDLRKLLPPIAFEDTIEEEGSTSATNSTNAKGKAKDKVLPVRGPLLPGALPPRGPPKVGGDGPNKGVSKLQLLVCGNQYIRTLKGRVERRDEEIMKLRREVHRLRYRVARLEGGVVEGGDMDVEQPEDEELDLERDLDAVEGMTVRIEPVPGLGEDEDDEDM